MGLVVPGAPNASLIKGGPKGVDMEVEVDFPAAIFCMHIGE